MAQARRRRDPDAIRGEFTIVAVPGTHRENPTGRHGRRRRHALPKADRQKILLDARRAGHSWRTAARMAGYRSVGSAYEAAQEAIAAIPKEAADEVRAIEIQRLDAIVNANWSMMEQGDRDAGLLILKASERRSKLLGLDQAEPPMLAMIDARTQVLVARLLDASPDELKVELEERLRLLAMDDDFGTSD
jgi:hypothetical protein